MSSTYTLTLDGEKVSFTPGESLFEVADGANKAIPTLCFDPRLEPFGACRLCVMEVEGIRNPVASCTTQAEAGMEVRSHSEALDHHRKVLLELVASEIRDSNAPELSGYASQELGDLLDQFQANTGRFLGALSGQSKGDPNPFLLRDYDNCISCYRCVRICAEQEGDDAISVMGRGFDTRITTEFDGILKDSSCTFCGQCVQTCPTGALGDKKALRAIELPGTVEETRSVCPYCGVGCSVDILSKGERLVGILPAMDGPANEGALCVKGQFAFDFVQHPDRLTVPLVRNEAGELEEATWEDALDRAASGFQKAVATHGRHSVYGVASGRTPTEADYLMQKFIRVAFGSNFIDNCSRA